MTVHIRKNWINRVFSYRVKINIISVSLFLNRDKVVDVKKLDKV